MVELLQNIYNCNFETKSTMGFLELLQAHLNWYKLNSWAFLQFPIALNPNKQKKICSEANLNIIKIVRNRLQEVKKLLSINRLKIIVLHRDPRGVMNSRIQKQWCTSKQLLQEIIVHLLFHFSCFNPIFNRLLNLDRSTGEGKFAPNDFWL